MAIIKTKIKEKSYMKIEKTGIQDNRLSWAATGLLTYLIGRPENWNVVIEHLKTVKTDGRDSTRTALNNLREFNYCHYFEIREKGKIVETVYLVFEKPIPYEEIKEEIEAENGQEIFYKKLKVKSDKTFENQDLKPETEKPFTAKPFTENPTLIIIDNNNNNRIKKETCNMSSDNLKTDKTELELNPKGYPQKDKWEKFLNQNLKGIDYIPSIQAAIKNLEQNLSQTEIERYLLENYNSGLKQNLNLAVIAKTISKGERIKTQETSINKNISPENNICLTRKQKIEKMKNNLDSRTLETIKNKIAKQLLEEMNISEESTITGELENYLVIMWNKNQQMNL